MESKVIVNDTYTILELSSPVFDQAEGLLLENLLNEHKNNGVQSIIVDLRELENITSEGGQFLEAFHNDFYTNGHSLVFADPSENVLKKLKQEQLHLIINICPSIADAVEIISTEMLERDLMNEN